MKTDQESAVTAQRYHRSSIYQTLFSIETGTGTRPLSISFDLHTRLKQMNAALAFSIPAAISVSEPPSLLTIHSRFVNFDHRIYVRFR